MQDNRAELETAIAWRETLLTAAALNVQSLRGLAETRERTALCEQILKREERLNAEIAQLRGEIAVMPWPDPSTPACGTRIPTTKTRSPGKGAVDRRRGRAASSQRRKKNG
jgi:hypothetical protein